MEMAIVGERGQITLPKKYRDKLGIKAKSPILIDITSDGIVVKPATLIESRIFSDEYVNELTSSDHITKDEKDEILDKWK